MSVDLTYWPGMKLVSDSSRIHARPDPLLANPLARPAGREAPSHGLAGRFLISSGPGTGRVVALQS
jgi:hypothetical protein